MSSNHDLVHWGSVAKGDFLWSNSLNRWVMAMEKPFVHVIRGTRVQRLQVVTPSGDLTQISEEGDPGSPVSPLVTVHTSVPEEFSAERVDNRVEEIRRKISELTQMVYNLATVEVYAEQATERDA